MNVNESRQAVGYIHAQKLYIKKRMIYIYIYIYIINVKKYIQMYLCCQGEHLVCGRRGNTGGSFAGL